MVHKETQGEKCGMCRNLKRPTTAKTKEHCAVAKFTILPHVTPSQTNKGLFIMEEI